MSASDSGFTAKIMSWLNAVLNGDTRLDRRRRRSDARLVGATGIEPVTPCL
jgi:hypothetical protein